MLASRDMLKMVDVTSLEEQCHKKLSEFLLHVDNRDGVWVEEILEEAIKMFGSRFNEEPELMPKTPSQKNRRGKKRFSSVKSNHSATRRLSKRESTSLKSSLRVSKRLRQKKDLENMKVLLDNESPCLRMTRSRAAKLARSSEAALKNPSIDLVRGRIPLVEISANDRHSAQLQLTAPQSTEKTPLTFVLSADEKSPIKKSQPLSKASLLVVPDTPESKITKESRVACKLKIANAVVSKTTENEEPTTCKMVLPAQQQELGQSSEMEPTQNVKESPRTPTGPRANRHSVRRSLIGRTSLSGKAVSVERYSLSRKGERKIRKSINRSMAKRRTTRKQSSTCRDVSCRISVVKPATDEIDSGPKLDPSSNSQEFDENHRLSLHSHKASMSAAILPAEEQQKASSKEIPSEMNNEAQEQPQSARRKPSYKRAVNELYDGQQMEAELSPPRKKTPSPQYPSSKAVRPFKTFLHTVQKNQILMMTPGSMSRNSTIRSFLKQNTPLSTNPKRGFVEKEKQRLEKLRKKEEMEQQRRQKLEEDKKRRLDEMKRKREERLRKVLQARERVEQKEEEKKRRLEQKHAQHDEKNEKMREEKTAEEKAKKVAEEKAKKMAAKKTEEQEALRKQDEEARKQRALQLEEENRHKELMQKKREEEQEKARKIAEQQQMELERQRKLSAERKREQEKLQLQLELERKEKAIRLQKEQERQLREQMGEKERQLEQQKREREKATAKATNKLLNVTLDVENPSPCTSYQMTPQAPKMNLNNYGMDLNSDDSTDDESQPRKPIPAWATGNALNQAIQQQYFNPPDTNALFGLVKSPKLEEIFYKSKPRYFKRTSSAVWNSPPFSSGKSVVGLPYTFKRC